MARCMFRITSTPARFTPRSRVRARIISSLRISSSPYSRVLPCVRAGLISPSRSYNRSVCGWMLYRSAIVEIITYPSDLRRDMGLFPVFSSYIRPLGNFGDPAEPHQHRQECLCHIGHCNKLKCCDRGELVWHRHSCLCSGKVQCLILITTFAKNTHSEPLVRLRMPVLHHLFMFVDDFGVDHIVSLAVSVAAGRCVCVRASGSGAAASRVRAGVLVHHFRQFVRRGG